MGKIIKHGKTYGGTSTIAGNISYDNSTSQLNSQTVQNAITELKTITDGTTKQATTLPTASSATVGQIYQYTGTTTNTYINGYFYKCVNDNGTYKWMDVVVQEDNSNGYAWAGTQAEWNALTSTQKAAYDGKEVLITDDSGSNEGVISSLEARVAELEGVQGIIIDDYEHAADVPSWGFIELVRSGNTVFITGDIAIQKMDTARQIICDIPLGYTLGTQGFGDRAEYGREYNLPFQAFQVTTSGSSVTRTDITDKIYAMGVTTYTDSSTDEMVANVYITYKDTITNLSKIELHFSGSWYTPDPFPTNS